ncbi:putative membrane protein YfcA [Mycobacterium frederiksbergense]|uniref:Probable membrane transporter protein n=1 Tax=Mycolicibacterium frederiksbergense TaxID=117567 RepID=A0ABT6L3F1_9MYCO|nr:sulfite exporter TauE/SafE family protein [Mycolicibacterium frederiksbergense]MDH6197482.1 putative membrane protein YfcA [Mycolicibacterium frederiksbergense]
MTFWVLVMVGAVSGVTTVLFGFGGGFVTVPVIVWANTQLGPDTMRTAVATSAVVVCAGAAIATASTRRDILSALRGNSTLVAALGMGGTLGGLAAKYAPAALAQWGFVVYVGVTLIDTLTRPGFLRSSDAGADPSAIRAAYGVPIGMVAAFLGVGGSILTVPLLRRAGHSMESATALANPLTFAIAAPAALPLLGSIDYPAAAALLLGATPVVIALRRRGPKIPDVTHARAYVGLLAAVTIAMTAAAIRAS